MKTFEEAVNAVIKTVPEDAPPEAHRAAMNAVGEYAVRTGDLMAEVDKHELLGFVFKTEADRACCAYHAVVGGFKLGMRIGMEMEKSETGGVKVE